MNQGLRSQARQQVDFYVFYGKRYLLSQCQIKNQIKCGNWSNNYSTEFYKKPYRIFLLKPLSNNYTQQSFDNYENKITSKNKNLRPLNLYYDYENNKQSQNAHSGL